MRKSGGIVALIAGLLAFIAAVFTLVVGGIGSNFNADAGDTIMGLGWGGILISFLIIVLGAVAMYAKTFIPGILIIIASIFGAIYGGSLVAVLMLLALVGGVLACISDDNLEPVEMDAQEAKAMTKKSLIKSVVLAVAILCVVLFLSKHNPPASEAPVSITIPDDTKSTDESSVLSDATIQVAPAEVAPAVDPIDKTHPDTNEANEPTIGAETAQPATSDHQISNIAFNDLYVDYNNMVGKKVLVSGHFLPYGDLGVLSESETSPTTLYINNSQLSREIRKLFLDNCSISSDCNLKLEGVVGDVQFLKGITTTRIIALETKTATYTLEAK